MCKTQINTICLSNLRKIAINETLLTVYKKRARWTFDRNFDFVPFQQETKARLKVTTDWEKKWRTVNLIWRQTPFDIRQGIKTPKAVSANIKYLAGAQRWALIVCKTRSILDMATCECSSYRLGNKGLVKRSTDQFRASQLVTKSNHNRRNRS